MGIIITPIPRATVYGTPAQVYTTVDAPGTTDEALRVDSEIAIFDAVAPTTIDYGDTAAVGSAAFAPRRDHAHGMAAAPDIALTAFNFAIIRLFGH